MSDENFVLLDRRRLLYAAIISGGGAALSACSPAVDFGEADLWVGFDERITERTLAEAEKLFGLAFTEAERRLILGNPNVAEDENFFAQQLASLRKRREYDFPFSLAPATTFDPRLPGVDYGLQASSLTLHPQAIKTFPVDAERIAFASVRQQAHWMATGRISSRELTEIYLERIGRYGGLLQCFITLTPDLARAQADSADRERANGRVRSPLHGVPYGIKDLFDTKDVPTTWGTEPYRNRVPTSVATVVRKLQDAGAVMLGKTTLGELAWGDVWFGGETRNPWNPKEGSSGSSAGSGSATAAGLCSFAIGTETTGSIISPSDRNGLAGMRPTFGRISRAGAMPLCWSLDKVGPMCRFAEDTAIVLSVLNGYDAQDSGSIDMGFAYDGRADVAGLTIGYDPRWFDGDSVKESDRQALAALHRLGGSIRELTLPELSVDEILPAVNIESAAAFEELTLSGRDELMRRQEYRAWPNSLRQSWFFSAVDYVQAERLRRKVMQDMREFFSQVDVVFGPTSGTPMPTVTNYTGQPALAIRGGFEEITSRSLFGHPENDSDPTLHRVPRSVSLWSELFQEGKLVTVGRALEAELGVAHERPPLS